MSKKKKKKIFGIQKLTWNATKMFIFGYFLRDKNVCFMLKFFSQRPYFIYLFIFLEPLDW